AAGRSQPRVWLRDQDLPGKGARREGFQTPWGFEPVQARWEHAVPGTVLGAEILKSLAYQIRPSCFAWRRESGKRSLGPGWVGGGGLQPSLDSYSAESGSDRTSLGLPEPTGPLWNLPQTWES